MISSTGGVIELAWFVATTTILLFSAITQQYILENLLTEAEEIRLNTISSKNWNKIYDLEHSLSGKCIQPLKNDIYEKALKKRQSITFVRSTVNVATLKSFRKP